MKKRVALCLGLLAIAISVPTSMYLVSWDRFYDRQEQMAIALSDAGFGAGMDSVGPARFAHSLGLGSGDLRRGREIKRIGFPYNVPCTDDDPYLLLEDVLPHVRLDSFDYYGPGFLPPHYESLRASGYEAPPFTNEHLGLFSQQRQLDRLTLKGADIDDEGLRCISSLNGLVILDLMGTYITDDGLRHLAHLSNLKSLTLSGTVITDKGLKHLRTLTHLEEVFVDTTLVSMEGVSQLSKWLPDTTVYYTPPEEMDVASPSE